MPATTPPASDGWRWLGVVDATDVAFTTAFGPAPLRSFEIWADEVSTVSISSVGGYRHPVLGFRIDARGGLMPEPYATRRYFDADSHILEPNDWLQPYADPGIRERLRVLEHPLAPSSDKRGRDRRR